MDIFLHGPLRIRRPSNTSLNSLKPAWRSTRLGSLPAPCGELARKRELQSSPVGGVDRNIVQRSRHSVQRCELGSTLRFLQQGKVRTAKGLTQARPVQRPNRNSTSAGTPDLYADVPERQFLHHPDLRIDVRRLYDCRCQPLRVRIYELVHPAANDTDIDPTNLSAAIPAKAETNA